MEQIINTQRIAVLCDSGTDVPQTFCKEHDVRVIPLHINFSDASYRSGVDISAAELVERMEQEIPKTSLPSPEEIHDAFKQAQKDGYEKAVFVTISSSLSATNQTGHLVAEQMDDFPVVVADTKSIGAAAGMVVMQAVRAIENGLPFSQLTEKIELFAQHTRVFFSTKTLDYLRKGGRISEAIYAIGRILNIKPVIMCDPKDGRYVVAKKARGWSKALASEIKLACEHARLFPRVRLAICCSEACQVFDELDKKLRLELSNLTEIIEIIHTKFSADLLVHTGPYAVGVAVMGLSGKNTSADE